MTAALLTWGHGLAAIVYALLALSLVLRRRTTNPAARWLCAALLASAFWAAAVAVRPYLPWALPSAAEALRNLVWLGFVATLLRGGEATPRAATALHIVLAVILALRIPAEFAPGGYTALGLALAGAIGLLVVVHNLYWLAEPASRWGVRLVAIGLAAMAGYDLNLYTIAWLDGHVPYDLFADRGLLMAALAPLFALASRRNRRWTIRLSRAATFQTLSLAAIGAYLIAMVVVARMIALAGGEWSRAAQIAVVFAMAVGGALFASSGRMRGWTRVQLLKHFFEHRYDYRAEWLRLIATLGRSGADARPLGERVVQAVADIVDSPAGVLLTGGGDALFAVSAGWNWHGGDVAAIAADGALARHLATTARIVDLAELRAGRETLAGEGAQVPPALLAQDAAWLAVPLIHDDRLAGIVVTAPPRAARPLDWEDFDLLRIAGRQAASHIAEARAARALSEARRFDEFNRRFAFIMHDIKNLVSQLSLLARNAARHADNPDFRADMIATLNASTAKMNDLLARLSQHHKSRAEPVRATPLRDVAETVAATARRRHPVAVEGAPTTALADPARLEQALGHLVHNAIDATPDDAPVRILFAEVGGMASIAVVDSGCGMAPDFLRDELFKPFASTKPGGFGIGAFEAREIVVAMGGRLDVASRPGAGSVFTISLPLVRDDAAADGGELVRA